MKHNPQHYLYRGDRLTAAALRYQRCEAVYDARGKCIRGRNGNMLVRFPDGTVVNVLARQLRKIKFPTQYGECPRCGESCQPDFVQPVPSAVDDYTEYATCCKCRLYWQYPRDADYHDRPAWDDVWEPEAFEKWEDC